MIDTPEWRAFAEELRTCCTFCGERLDNGKPLWEGLCHLECRHRARASTGRFPESEAWVEANEKGHGTFLRFA